MPRATCRNRIPRSATHAATLPPPLHPPPTAHTPTTSHTECSWYFNGKCQGQ